MEELEEFLAEAAQNILRALMARDASRTSVSDSDAGDQCCRELDYALGISDACGNLIRSEHSESYNGGQLYTLLHHSLIQRLNNVLPIDGRWR